MKRALSRVNEFWCKTMHPAPMWPVHGRYKCPSCHRVYPVAWERREALVCSPVKAAAPGSNGAVSPQASDASLIVPALSR